MSIQGLEFVTKSIKSCLSCVERPNGLDERLNQTLTAALVKFVNENEDDWDVLIKSALFAYRTSKNDSTKLTPFSIADVFPCTCSTSRDGNQVNPSNDGEKPEDAAPDFKESLKLD